VRGTQLYDTVEGERNVSIGENKKRKLPKKKRRQKLWVSALGIREKQTSDGKEILDKKNKEKGRTKQKMTKGACLLKEKTN